VYLLKSVGKRAALSFPQNLENIPNSASLVTDGFKPLPISTEA